jgi:hypothetical protein
LNDKVTVGSCVNQGQANQECLRAVCCAFYDGQKNVHFEGLYVGLCGAGFPMPDIYHHHLKLASLSETASKEAALIPLNFATVNVADS